MFRKDEGSMLIGRSTVLACSLSVLLSACGGGGIDTAMNGAGSSNSGGSSGPGVVSGGGGGGGGADFSPGGPNDTSLQSGTEFTPVAENPSEPTTNPLTEGLRRIPILGALVPTTTVPVAPGTGGGNGTNEGSIPGQQAGTANYASGSPRAIAFEKIAARRQQCGFAPFHQNSQLDTAAQAHADYLRLNMRPSEHLEEQGKPGFTGVRVGDRIRAAGYSPASGKFGFETIGPAQEDFQLTQAHFEGLLGIPYHSFVFFVPNSELGIGEAQYTDARGKFFSNAVFNFATHSSGPSQVVIPASSVPLTFPCDGVDGVYFENTIAEAPRPIVNGRERALSGRLDSIGTPITVIGEFTDRVQLTFARLTPVVGSAQTGSFAGGAPDVNRERNSMRTDDATNLTLMQASTDKNLAAQGLEFVALVQPAARLEPSTVYEVRIEGTIARAGQTTPSQFVRQFRFKTSAPDPLVCPPSSTRCTGHN